MPAPSSPDKNLTIRIDRKLLKQITAEAEQSGVSRQAWITAVLEEATIRRFRVQCFHPQDVRINGWCYTCKTFIGED